METEKFESWAIIEIFGHTQIAGKVSEASIGGCSFIRVDVPECDGKPAFTKFYGNGAIYSMTPCGEEIALAAVKSIRHAPVNVYIPAQRQLPGLEDRRLCRDCGESVEDCRC